MSSNERPQSVRELIDLCCTLNTDVVSPGTRRLYLAALSAFERFLERVALLDDLNDLTFAKFIEWRAERVANQTVRGDASKLLAAWRWAAGGQRKWVDAPDIKAPRGTHKAPRALDREQLSTLFDVAACSESVIAGIPYSIYFPAILYVLWDTSERIGAVYQLRRENVDANNGWLTFPAEMRKGGREARQYKLRRQATLALEKLLETTDRAQPFAVMSMPSLYHHLARLVARAGLPDWVKFHTIRRSHATHLTVAGGDARRSLGHSSEAVTDRSHRDQRIIGESAKQPCDILFDPMKQSFWGRLWRKLRTG